MNKMQLKISELKSLGFIVSQEGEYGMNGRRYKYCIMQKGSEKIRVNHQGGTKGMIR